MRRMTCFIMAAALVLGMAQCNKEKPVNGDSADDNKIHIVLKVGNDDGKHNVYTNSGVVEYEDNDVIYVGDGTRYIGTLTCTNGEFSGDILEPSTNGDGYLHFYFVGRASHVDPEVGDANIIVDISDQTQKLPVLSYGHSDETYTTSQKTYTCKLLNQCALVEFDLSNGTSNEVSVSGLFTRATVNFANPGITARSTQGTITLWPDASDNTKKWAILLPQTNIDASSVSIDGFEPATANVPDITVNAFIHGDGKAVTISNTPTYIPVYDENISINGNGGKVKFSQGNLQYRASTGAWRFATNQWDHVGGTTTNSVSYGNVSGSSNNSIAYNYSGWIDLFGWATSGQNYGATCYQPYSTAPYADRYLAYGQAGYNLSDQSGAADWGYNTISGGGTYRWRTLTNDEWLYIIYTRPTANNIRFAKAVVSGVNGLILLPDNWSGSNYTLNSPNTKDAAFTTNEISANVWNSVFEPNGAVFLPITGYRTNTDLYGDAIGMYWSATYGMSSSPSAYNVNFSNATIGYLAADEFYYMATYYGLSVRLVRDVN